MNKKLVDFTAEEEAYRRGYSHGFLAAKRSNVTEQEVYAWRHSDECTAPPGSCYAGMEMQGLTKNEEHRFFLNQLKKVWNN